MGMGVCTRLRSVAVVAATGATVVLAAPIAARAASVTAQPAAELSVFTAPVSVLANRMLKPHKSAALSLTAASLPGDASSVEATVTITAGARASRVSIGGSSLYAGARQTTTTTLLLALPSGRTLTATDTAGTAHVSVLLDGYDAPSADTATLESEVSTLKSQVATLQSQLSSLQGTVSGVQGTANSLASTFKGVTRGNGPQGYDTLIFSGMNLQIVNGTGDETSLNGLGNLIVGYADNNDSVWPRTGSHNLITGDDGGWSSYGGLIGGEDNNVTGAFGSAAGGYDNHATGQWASASGGEFNTASGTDAAVNGGLNNSASGTNAAIAGGGDGTASSSGSTIAGGYLNGASYPWSAVSGGESNTAASPWGWIGGGYGSTVTSKCQGVPAVPTTGC